MGNGLGFLAVDVGSQVYRQHHDGFAPSAKDRACIAAVGAALVMTALMPLDVVVKRLQVGRRGRGGGGVWLSICLPSSLSLSLSLSLDLLLTDLVRMITLFFLAVVAGAPAARIRQRRVAGSSGCCQGFCYDTAPPHVPLARHAAAHHHHPAD